MLAVFAKPDSSSKLSNDGNWTFAKIGHPVCEEKDVFHSEFLANIVLYVPFLFTYLPVGNELRKNIPLVIERARARLANPNLILGPMSFYSYGENSTKKYVEKLGGKEFEPVGPTSEHNTREIMAARDCGDILAVASDWRVFIGWRPALIKDWAKLTRMASSCHDVPLAMIASKILQSKGFTDFSARVKDTPVPEGSYETNPQLSVPNVVETAAKKLSTSKESAAYYLQLLALANPTDKNIRLWNGWTAGQLKRAVEELLDKKLVLEAKRARAGRKVFLPGGWEAFKKPLPPMESWKLPLYQIKRRKEGPIDVPLERALPLKPIHELFVLAWQRIALGEVPRYEEVS